MKHLQGPVVKLSRRALLRLAVLWQGDQHFAPADCSV